MSSSKNFDEICSSIKMINCILDLRSMTKLISDIEKYNHPQLLIWKNNFTTKFFTDLKKYMENYNPSSSGKYLKILCISNFSAFIYLYDMWIKLTLYRENLFKPTSEDFFLDKFFDFVSKYEFKIVASDEQIDSVNKEIRDDYFYKSVETLVSESIGQIKLNMNTNDTEDMLTKYEEFLNKINLKNQKQELPDDLK